MTTQPLPKTDSIQELARFWDTHDLTDFQRQLEEVKEPIFARRTVIPLKLEPDEADAVRRIAKAKGVADEDLIRQWIQDGIQAR